jgi:sporulation protein YlmC with PRC-barrel domain
MRCFKTQGTKKTSQKLLKGRKIMTKKSIRISAGFIVAAAVVLFGAQSVGAQSDKSDKRSTPPVAGAQTIGVTQAEVQLVATGWSAKKKILGKAVYNDKGQRIGTVDDIIISPDHKVTYAIVGAGGFIGVGKHDVAIPVTQLTQESDKIVLPGATKEALREMPEFKYAA